MADRFKRDVNITFGTKKTYTDYGLILVNEDFGVPDLQRSTVIVMGRDGEVDLTKMIDSTPHFNNRTAKWKFALTHSKQPYWYNVFSTLLNELHGKTMYIKSDNEPEFTLYGCVRVTSFTKFQSPGYIEIEADCQPFRIMYKGNTSGNWEWDPFSFVNGITYTKVHTQAVGGATESGTLVNAGYKTVGLSFKSDDNGSVTFDGTTYTLTANTMLTGLYLDPGSTNFTFALDTADATLTAYYDMEAL